MFSQCPLHAPNWAEELVLIFCLFGGFWGVSPIAVRSADAEEQCSVRGGGHGQGEGSTGVALLLARRGTRQHVFSQRNVKVRSVMIY